MKLSKQGIWFDYHGDRLLWKWWWKRTNNSIYYSKVLARDYVSLNEYWKEVGIFEEAARKHKVKGYSIKEVLYQWVEHAFRNDIVIVLTDINVEMKSTNFWRSIPVIERRELLKDFPVLFFPDIHKARSVLTSLNEDFATAYLFDRGKLVGVNFDTGTRK